MIRKDLPHVFAYGSENHVALLGKFEAEIHCGNRHVLAWFQVSHSLDDSLLGYKTSSQLGIVKIDEINLVQGTRTEVYNNASSGRWHQESTPLWQELQPHGTNISHGLLHIHHTDHFNDMVIVDQTL